MTIQRRWCSTWFDRISDPVKVGFVNFLYTLLLFSLAGQEQRLVDVSYLPMLGDIRSQAKDAFSARFISG